jgi:hypothetical protein
MYIDGEDYEEYKNIGVYRSKESAEKAMYLDIQQRTSGISHYYKENLCVVTKRYELEDDGDGHKLWSYGFPQGNGYSITEFILDEIKE